MAFKRHSPLESNLRKQGIRFVAGVDEAGRGPLAGPVVAAACLIPQGVKLQGIQDSKKLSPEKREKLFERICSEAYAYAVGIVSVEDIDQINILQATKKAMREALSKLSITPDYLLIDGNQGINVAIPQKLIIKGDSASVSIGAASIIAKVTRDRLMASLEKDLPNFSFARHKGYGTALHQKEIEQFGITAYHRKSFAPIALVLNKG